MLWSLYIYIYLSLELTINVAHKKWNYPEAQTYTNANSLRHVTALAWCLIHIFFQNKPRTMSPILKNRRKTWLPRVYADKDSCAVELARWKRMSITKRAFLRVYIYKDIRGIICAAKVREEETKRVRHIVSKSIKKML